VHAGHLPCTRTDILTLVCSVCFGVWRGAARAYFCACLLLIYLSVYLSTCMYVCMHVRMYVSCAGFFPVFLFWILPCPRLPPSWCVSGCRWVSIAEVDAITGGAFCSHRVGLSLPPKSQRAEADIQQVSYEKLKKPGRREMSLDEEGKTSMRAFNQRSLEASQLAVAWLRGGQHSGLEAARPSLDYCSAAE